MKNVIMSRSDYAATRQFLHFSNIRWRDCGFSAIVPAWDECIACDEICYSGETAPQLAYAALQKHYPGMRLAWRRDELALLDSRVPRLFLGEKFDELYYVDVKSAFAQLYQYLYLHSEFPFKRQKHPLREIALELWDKKIARNAVIGITRSTQNKWVEGEKVWYTQKRNPYLSPTLWAQITGVLNQIAQQMVKFGAIWVNTDGYIFERERSYRSAIHFFLDNQIVCTHGSGKGEIRALQNIKIEGVKSTQSGDVGKQPVRHIEESNIDFLAQWRKNRNEQ